MGQEGFALFVERALKRNEERALLEKDQVICTEKKGDLVVAETNASSPKRKRSGPGSAPQSQRRTSGRIFPKNREYRNQANTEEAGTTGRGVRVRGVREVRRAQGRSKGEVAKSKDDFLETQRFVIRQTT